MNANLRIGSLLIGLLLCLFALTACKSAPCERVTAPIEWEDGLAQCPDRTTLSSDVAMKGEAG
jgi:hypothetical protein